MVPLLIFRTLTEMAYLTNIVKRYYTVKACAKYKAQALAIKELCY